MKGHGSHFGHAFAEGNVLACPLSLAAIHRIAIQILRARRAMSRCRVGVLTHDELRESSRTVRVYSASEKERMCVEISHLRNQNQ